MHKPLWLSKSMYSKALTLMRVLASHRFEGASRLILGAPEKVLTCVGHFLDGLFVAVGVVAQTLYECEIDYLDG